MAKKLCLMRTVAFFLVVLLLMAGAIWVPTRVNLPPTYSGILIVDTSDGQGSCFVVDHRDGWWYAITAGHVIESDDGYPIDITVDDELYEVEIIRESSNEDLALIRFKSPEEYKVYSFGRAEVGEFCTTVGFNRGRMVYKGYVVSADWKGYVVANGGVVLGCSGGALLNDRSQVIGITVAIPVYGFGALDGTVLYVPSRFAESLAITIGD